MFQPGVRKFRRLRRIYYRVSILEKASSFELDTTKKKSRKLQYRYWKFFLSMNGVGVEKFRTVKFYVPEVLNVHVNESEKKIYFYRDFFCKQ